MTQAAVSYQVRALEEKLGIALFAREKGRVKLTDAGRRAAPQISGAFDILSDAFADLREEDDAVLTISSANSIAANWLAPKLGKFQLANPGLAVRLLASNELVDFARDGVDCGIRLADKPGEGLVGHALFEAHVIPMASPEWLAANPLETPADMQKVMRLTSNDGWWRCWFDAAGIAIPDQAPAGLHLDSQLLEGAVALSGQGFAILDPMMWPNEIRSGRLVAPFPILAPTGRRYWLVTPEGRRNVRKIRLFRDWLLAEAAKASKSDWQDALRHA